LIILHSSAKDNQCSESFYFEMNAAFELCPEVQQSSIDIYFTCGSVTSILSLVASTIVVASYIFLPNLHRNKSFRYIGYLSLTNVILSISSLATNEYAINYKVMTYPFLLLQNYASVSVILWGIIFATNVYNIISNKSANWANWVSNEIICLALGFILPIPLALVLLWSELGQATLIQTYIVLYGLYATALIALLFLYVKTMTKVRDVMEYESAKRACLQIVGYSIVLTINTICNLVAVIESQIRGCVPENYFWLHSVWYWQGFVDAIVYGMNPVFRQELRALCLRKDTTSDGMLVMAVNRDSSEIA